MTCYLRGGLFFSFLLTVIFAHTQQDPFFMPFEGDVFKLPAKRVMNSKFKYGDYILEYEKIASISWKEINIKKTHTDIPFPDVDRKDRFGMVLESEMVIKQNGCYEFILNSDDGSVFWIGDQEIINNDGMHKMRLRKDTLMLKKGKYPIKLWYYQGFVHQYGFIFDGKYLSENCPSAKDLSDLGSILKKEKKITLNCQHLFDYDSYELKEDVLVSLDSMIVKLQETKIKSITINGYTCNKGTDDYNQKLSQQRADHILAYLVKKLNNQKIIFRAMGYGSENPKFPNENEESRQKNRRVELIIE